METAFAETGTEIEALSLYPKVQFAEKYPVRYSNGT